MSISGGKQYMKCYLLRDLLAFPAGDSGALALGDLLGLDPGHQGADTPGLLLAVPDGNLLARLTVQLMAVNFGTWRHCSWGS